MKTVDDSSYSIFQVVDPLLPSGIKGNSVLSLEALIRSRVLIVMLLSSVVSTLTCLFLLGIFQLITEHDFTNALIITAICFVMSILEYMYFYRFANLNFSAVMYSLSFFLVVVLAVFLTGGLESPVKQVLITCPVISFVISGRQEGIYNAALIFVIGVILLILDGLNIQLIQLMPEEIMPYLSGLIWLITIVLVVLCLYIYDILLEDKRSIRARSE